MTNPSIASGTDVQFVAAGVYRAGACNIGPAEIRRRRLSGHVGLLAALAVLALLAVVGVPPITRLLVALPATLSAAGYLQARMRFCANYGWRGIFNVGDIGDGDSVADPVARAADRRLALRVGLASLAIGLLAGVAAVLLPV